MQLPPSPPTPLALPGPQGPKTQVAAHISLVKRFLGRIDVEVSTQVLRETFGPAPTLFAIARYLNDRGLPGRVHSASEADVDALTLPTLFCTENEPCLELLSVSKTHVMIEAPDGRSIKMSRSELRKKGMTYAIDRFPTLGTEGSIVRRLLDAFRRAPMMRKAATRLVFLTLFMGALGLLMPLVARMTMDQALPDGDRSLLRIVAAGVVVLAVHAAWASWLRAKTIRFIETRMRYVVSQGLFEHALHLPFQALLSRGPGQTRQAIASGGELGRIITTGLFVPILESVSIVGYGLILLTSLGPIAYVSAGAALGLAITGYLVGLLVRSRQMAYFDAQSREQDELVQMLSGAITVKIAAAESLAASKWLRTLVDEQLADFRKQRVELTFHRMSQFFAQLVSGAVLVWGAWDCLAGKLSLGQLMAGLQASAGLLAASEAVVAIMLRFQDAKSHAAQVDRLLGTPIEHTGRAVEEAPADLRMTGDAIVIDNVWFRHAPTAPWVLEGFSMRVRAGDTVELSWPSGSGKTTLLRLIAGLYVPERGVVTIAGYEPHAARHIVSYLPQLTHLYNGSVLENLRLLSGGADYARIMKAAQATGLQQVVDAWPMGFETRVATGGTNVSSGQKQLIALTACVASYRPVLLLDEAMAHIDRLTRQKLKAEGLFAGRTVITVVHERD